MADEKDYEIETLRRLFAVVHEKRTKPSRLKRILAWFGGGKVAKRKSATEVVKSTAATEKQAA